MPCPLCQKEGKKTFSMFAFLLLTINQEERKKEPCKGRTPERKNTPIKKTMKTITGPESVTGKFHKSPEARRFLCLSAAEILKDQPARNFQTVPAGGVDSKAFWEAIPEQHKRRGKANARQLSAAARRIFSWHFLCENLHEL